MGSGISYICKKCGQAKRVLEGVGFATCDENQLLENQCEKLIKMAERKNNVKNIEKLKEMAILSEKHLELDFGYTNYYCDNCHFLNNEFKYTIISGNKIFVPEYKCRYCNNILRIKREQGELNLKCDFCEGTDFDFDIDNIRFILWD